MHWNKSEKSFGQFWNDKIKLIKARNIALLFFVIIILGLIGFNICNNKSFLEASISSLLSLLIVVVISFYLTQRINDEREKNKIIIRILEQIAESVYDPQIFAFEGKKEIRLAFIAQRRVSNKIKILNNYKLEPKVKEVSDKLQAEFNKARDIYSANCYTEQESEDFKYKIQSEIELIENCCDEIIASLYA